MPSYTSGPHVVDGVGGRVSNIALRCPPRAVISTIKFDQVSGVEADCEFEVYTRREAAPPDSLIESSESSASLNVSLQGPASAYSVFGPRTRTAGVAFIESDKLYPYENRDGSPSLRERRLYLRLRPAGTGAKTFALTFELTVE